MPLINAAWYQHAACTPTHLRLEVADVSLPWSAALVQLAKLALAPVAHTLQIIYRLVLPL